MDYKFYENVNNTVSSEMFYSLMAIFHEKLPIATSFFKLKKKFREKREEGGFNSASPVRTIASPKIMRGLSVPKNQTNSFKTEQRNGSRDWGRSPQIIIKNIKN